MQISAVSPSFQGKRDRIDALINLDDQSVRQIAYLQTAQKANEKKHNKITNSLILAAPVAAGLGAAVFTKGKTKIFSREVSGLSASLANGLKAGGLWGATLGAVGLVGLAKAELSKKSESVRKFDREHPVLSLAALLAAGFAAISLTGRAAGKLASFEAPKFLQKATTKVNKFLNKNKNVLALKTKVNNFAKKVPSALKDFGATVLDWAPETLLLGGLIHSVSHSAAMNREYSKNYNDLKEKQLNLAKARKSELQLENDFLKTNIQNREDLELVKNPMKDLPDEVVEKVNELHDSEEVDDD